MSIVPLHPCVALCRGNDADTVLARVKDLA
jgi:hypothetical protein